jgi:hypothetical protein
MIGRESSEAERSAEHDGGTGSPTWRGGRTGCRPLERLPNAPCHRAPGCATARWALTNDTSSRLAAHAREAHHPQREQTPAVNPYAVPREAPERDSRVPVDEQIEELPDNPNSQPAWAWDEARRQCVWRTVPGSSRPAARSARPPVSRTHSHGRAERVYGCRSGLSE